MSHHRHPLAARALHARTADEDMPSPCLSVCTMSPASGLCLGCHRTLDEIAAWSRMSAAAKRAVWVQIEQRAQLSLAADRP